MRYSKMTEAEVRAALNDPNKLVFWAAKKGAPMALMPKTPRDRRRPYATMEPMTRGRVESVADGKVVVVDDYSLGGPVAIEHSLFYVDTL